MCGDVVKAYIMLINGARAGEAYNIGSGKAIPVQHILDTFITLSHIDIKIEQDSSKMRPTDQPISYGDISKIKKEIGLATNHFFRR